MMTGMKIWNLLQELTIINIIKLEKKEVRKIGRRFQKGIWGFLHLKKPDKN